MKNWCTGFSINNLLELSEIDRWSNARSQFFTIEPCYEIFHQKKQENNLREGA